MMDGSSSNRYAGDRDALRNRTVVAAATFLFLAASLLFLDRKGFWLDELFSAVFVAAPADAFRHVIARREANMTLYYLILRGWSAFGAGDAFLRLPSVLFGAACIPAFHALGRRLVGNNAALCATAMLALSGFLFVHARQARGYTMFLLFVILSGIAFLRMTDGGYRRRDATVFALVSALAAWTHFFALLTTAALGLSLLFRPGAPALRAKAFVAFAGWGVAVSPLLLFMFTRDKGQIGWIPSPFPSEILAFGKQLCGGTVLLVPPFVALAAAGTVELRRRFRARETGACPEAAVIGFWLFFPPLAALAFSILKPVFLTRYLIGTLPPFLLLCGLGIEAIRPRRFAVLVAAWLLAGQFLVLPDNWNSPPEDWRAIVREVRAEARPGDGVVCLRANLSGPMAFERYGAIPMDGLPAAPPLVLPRRFDLDRFSEGTIREPSVGEAVRAAASCRRVWVLTHTGGVAAGKLHPAIESIGRRLSERRYGKIRVILIDRG